MGFGLAVFDSTKDAMKAEEIFKLNKLAVRIVSAPPQLAANCGFALRYPIEMEPRMFRYLQQENIQEVNLYHGTAVGMKVNYEWVCGTPNIKCIEG